MPGTARNCPACGTKIPAAFPGGLCPACMLAGIGGERVPSEKKETRSEEEESPGGEALSSDRTSGGTWAFHPPSREDIDWAFPGLERVEFVARDSNRAVYRATGATDSRALVIQVIGSPLSEGEGGPGVTEAIGGLLSLDHSGWPRFEEAGWRSIESDSYLVLRSEFRKTPNLREILRRGKLAPERAVAILRSLCETLAPIHCRGIAHLGLRPETIAVSHVDEVFLTESGVGERIAHLLAPPSGGEAAGDSSSCYSAPEQWEDRLGGDHRSDIFALGAIFHEMLTGERAEGMFAPPSDSLPERWKFLDAVVYGAMEREPTRRFQGVDEILPHLCEPTATLEKIEEEAPAPVSPVLLWILGGIGGLLVIGLLAWTFG